jgi:hypothetical protein
MEQKVTHFQVGQKVVCIANGTWEKTKVLVPDIIVPLKNEIYTVREIYLDPVLDVVGIRLKEIVNKRYKYENHPEPMEPGWFPADFRPIKETSIEVFEKLLINPPKELIKGDKEVENV